MTTPRRNLRRARARLGDPIHADRIRVLNGLLKICGKIGRMQTAAAQRRACREVGGLLRTLLAKEKAMLGSPRR